MALFGKKTTEEKKVDKKDDSSKDQAAKNSMKDLYDASDTSMKPKTETKKKDTKKDKVNGRAYQILVKPLITEKAAAMGVESKYVFEVFKSANKIEIAKAIEEVYGVKPIGVNIVNKLGKKVRTGRIMGRRKDWKKAIITLPKGKTINIYEGV